MLTVLPVSLCKEEGVGATQAFYRPFSFQVIKLLGRTRRLGETPLLACPQGQARQVVRGKVVLA